MRSRLAVVVALILVITITLTGMGAVDHHLSGRRGTTPRCEKIGEPSLIIASQQTPAA